MDVTGSQNTDYAPDCKYCLRRLNANSAVPNLQLQITCLQILGHKPSTDECDIKKCAYCGKIVLGTILLEHQLRCVYDLYAPDNYMCDTCKSSGYMEFHTVEEQVEMAMEISEFEERRKMFVELLSEVPVPNCSNQIDPPVAIPADVAPPVPQDILEPVRPIRSRDSRGRFVKVANLYAAPVKRARKRDSLGRFAQEDDEPRPRQESRKKEN